MFGCSQLVAGLRHWAYQREFLCGVQEAGGMMALNVQNAASLNAATDFSGAAHQRPSSVSSCCMSLRTVSSLKADQLIAGQQVVGGMMYYSSTDRF